MRVFYACLKYALNILGNVLKKRYVLSYIDVEGNIKKRNVFEKYAVVIFAGFKYLFDRLISIIGIIFLSPLMACIAIAIKIDSKGPVLFKQIRTGKMGREFYIYKFRTMVQNNDVHDYSKKDEHTRVGRFLRKTSLDELPQLFSILTGRMSLIGPRPWIPEYYENMNELQKHRYDVRPGLTGLAQVLGRNNISIFTKIEYDLKYIKNYSLSQDVFIIFLTIIKVFSTNGADAGKSTIQNELLLLNQNRLIHNEINYLNSTITGNVNYNGLKIVKKGVLGTLIFVVRRLITFNIEKKEKLEE